MSLEMETLDQLTCGDMPLDVIRKIYPDDVSFLQGILGLLNNGDVRLYMHTDSDVPKWQWRELFIERTVLQKLDVLRLDLTQQGAKRIQ